MSDYNDLLQERQRQEEKAFTNVQAEDERTENALKSLQQGDQQRKEGQSLSKQKQNLSDYLNMYQNAGQNVLREKAGKTLLLAREGSLIEEKGPLTRISNYKDRKKYKEVSVEMNARYRDITDPAEKQYRIEKEQYQNAEHAFDDLIGDYISQTIAAHPEFLSDLFNREAVLKELLDAFIPEREFTYNPPSKDQRRMATAFLASFRDNPEGMLKKMQTSLQSERLSRNARDPRYVQKNYRKVVFDMKKRMALGKVFSRAIKGGEYSGRRYEAGEMKKAAENMQEMLQALDLLMLRHNQAAGALVPQDDNEEAAIAAFMRYKNAYEKVRRIEGGLNNRYKNLVNLAIAKKGKLYDPAPIHSDYRAGSQLIADKESVIDGMRMSREALKIGTHNISLYPMESYAYNVVMDELEKAVKSANFTRFKKDALGGVKSEPGLPESFLSRTKKKEEAKLAVLESRIRDLTDIANVLKKGRALKDLNPRCRTLYNAEILLPAMDARRREGLEKVKLELEKEEQKGTRDVQNREKESRAGDYEVTGSMCMAAETDLDQTRENRRDVIAEEIYRNALEEERRQWSETDKQREARIRYKLSRGKKAGTLLAAYYKDKLDREKSFRQRFENEELRKRYGIEAKIENALKEQEKERINKLLYSEKEKKWSSLTEREKLKHYKQFAGIDKESDYIPEKLDENKLLTLPPLVAQDLRRINVLRESARMLRLQEARLREEAAKKAAEEEQRKKLALIEEFRPRKEQFLKEIGKKEQDAYDLLNRNQSKQGALFEKDLKELRNLLSTVMAFKEEHGAKLDESGTLEIDKLQNKLETELNEKQSILNSQIDRFRNEIIEDRRTLTEKVLKEGTIEEAQALITRIRSKKETLDSVYLDQGKQKEGEGFARSTEEELKTAEKVVASFRYQNYEKDLTELSGEGAGLSTEKEEINFYPNVLTNELVRGNRISDFVVKVAAFKNAHADDKDLHYFQKGEKLKKTDEIIDSMRTNALKTLDKLLFGEDGLRNLDEFIKDNGTFKGKEAIGDYRNLMLSYYVKIGTGYLMLTENQKLSGKEQKKRAAIEERVKKLENASIGAGIQSEIELLSLLNIAVTNEENEELKAEAQRLRERLDEEKEKKRRAMEEQASNAFSYEAKNRTANINLPSMTGAYQHMEKEYNGFAGIFQRENLLEQAKKMKTFPTRVQVETVNKLTRANKLRDAKINAVLDNILALSKEIEEAFPGLKDNETDIPELKEYREVLSKVKTLKEEMKKQAAENDAATILLFTRLQKTGLESRVKGTVKRIHERDFDAVADFQKYIGSIRELENRFPLFRQDPDVSKEYGDYMVELNARYEEVHSEMEKEQELIDKETETALKVKEKAERQELEITEKLKSFDQTYLEIQSATGEILIKDQPTEEELTYLMKEAQSCHDLLMQPEVLALGSTRSEAYESFKEKVLCYAKTLENKAMPLLTKKYINVLNIRIAEVQNNAVLGRVMIYVPSNKQKKEPLVLKPKEVKELAEVRKELVDILHSEENRRLMERGEKSIEAFCNQLLNRIERCGALAGIEA